MGKNDSAAGPPASTATEGRRLDSWKEIAAYLKRDVRTVQRWETVEGLPAHRHVHKLRSSVYAYVEELDQWWTGRQQALESLPAANSVKSKRTLWYGAAATLAVTFAASWLLLTSRRVDRQLNVHPMTGERGVESNPSFSPDGTKVAYVWWKEDDDYSDIFVRSLISDESLRITSTPITGEGPVVWSPDGNWLAYFGLRDGKRWIIVSPATGGREKKIANVNSFPFDMLPHLLSWAPDSQTLLFPDYVPGENFVAIHAASTASGERWRVTHPDAGGVDTSPSVSADGTRLAFLRSATANLTGRIHIAPVSNSLHTIGVAAPLSQEPRSAAGLMWVGREHRLVYAFTRFSMGTPGLWSVRTDRREGPRLIFPFPPSYSVTATMSADGQRIAFASYIGNRGFTRLDFPADPSRESVLHGLIGSAAGDQNPNLSPTGDRIAYGSSRSGHPEVWISKTDGSQPIRLTQFGGPLTGTPRWSPDETQIAFDSAANFNSDIWIVNSEGGQPRRLTTEPSAEFNPSWSVDGNSIYFTSNRTGRHEIWKAPAAGGAAVQITRNEGFGGFESPDGKYFYYGTKYIYPALRRVPVNGGAEETLVPRIRYIHDLRVGRSGVYFLADCRPCQSLKQAWELQRYTFSTGELDVLARFRARMSMGLAISPDETWALVNVWERTTVNIILVEGVN